MLTLQQIELKEQNDDEKSQSTEPNKMKTIFNNELSNTISIRQSITQDNYGKTLERVVNESPIKLGVADSQESATDGSPMKCVDQFQIRIKKPLSHSFENNQIEGHA